MAFIIFCLPCQMGNTFKPSLIHLKTLCVFKEQPISAIEGLTVQFESKAGSRYFILSRNVSLVQSLGTIS
jgi:hypothetical protein